MALLDGISTDYRVALEKNRWLFKSRRLQADEIEFKAVLKEEASKMFLPMDPDDISMT